LAAGSRFQVVTVSWVTSGLAAAGMAVARVAALPLDVEVRTTMK
jgi:hypothetical protein